MSKGGAVAVIVGTVIFYSFIGWGIAQLYHEDRYIDVVSSWSVTDPNQGNPYSDSDTSSWWDSGQS